MDRQVAESGELSPTGQTPVGVVIILLTAQLVFPQATVCVLRPSTGGAGERPLVRSGPGLVGPEVASGPEHLLTVYTPERMPSVSSAMVSGHAAARREPFSADGTGEGAGLAVDAAGPSASWHHLFTCESV